MTVVECLTRTIDAAQRSGAAAQIEPDPEGAPTEEEQEI